VDATGTVEALRSTPFALAPSSRTPNERRDTLMAQLARDCIVVVPGKTPGSDRPSDASYGRCSNHGVSPHDKERHHGHRT